MISPKNIQPTVGSNQSSERWLMIVICLVGAIRIFICAASLPLFCDIDEHQHFDLVHKFARGYWPDNSPQPWDNTTQYITAVYGSNEFLTPKSELHRMFPLPGYRIQPDAFRKTVIIQRMQTHSMNENHEAHSPPLYYLIAAVWYNAGKLLGFSEPHCAYWVRFMNIPIIVASTIMTFQFGKRHFSTFVAFASALLVAIFPSPSLMTINNDVLCPLAVLFALDLILRWLDSEANLLFSIGAGFATSAAVLVKLTNAPLLVIFLVVTIWKVFCASKAKRLRAELMSITAYLSFCLLPLFTWAVHNRITLGDWMGTRYKIRYLGWEPKPMSEMFNHPFFSQEGQFLYWSRLATSFLTGDMSWHGELAMSADFAGGVMLVVCLFASIGLISIWRERVNGVHSSRGTVGLLSGLLFGLSACFLISLSLAYDFGACFYPSRAYPYLNSGRLILGVLFPGLMIFAWGIEVTCRRTRWAQKILIMASVCAFLGPQSVLVAKTIGNNSNWFHTPMEEIRIFDS